MRKMPLYEVEAEYFEGREPEMEAERELAIGVVLQAFLDIDKFMRLPERAPHDIGRRSRWQSARLAAHSAYRFLRGEDEYQEPRECWCAMAGLSCDVGELVDRRFRGSIHRLR